jgi:hypothetical protein
VLRLYASELDAERLWEVMSAMGLHDKVGAWWWWRRQLCWVLPHNSAS